MIRKLGIIFIVSAFFIGAISTTALSNDLPPEWDANTYYNTGDIVTYEGNVYEMINIPFQGYGDANWNPEDAVSQWKFIGNTTGYGLVAYYPFNGNANDESGNGNDGTVNEAVLTEDRFGQANSSYYFDGINDFINIGKPIPEKIRMPYGFTIGVWVKPAAYSNNNNDNNLLGGIVASQYDPEHAGYSVMIDYRESAHGGSKGGVHFQVGSSTGYWTSSNEGTTQSLLPIDKWTYITVVAEVENQYKVYFNGIEVANWSPKQSIIYTNNCRFAIGWNQHIDNSKRFFYGGIDDVRIYNRALSETEIQELYNEPNNTCIEDDTGSIDVATSKGRYGGTVSVPIRIQNAPNDVSAFGFDINFDSTILTYKGFTKGSLVQDFDYFDVNLMTDGILRCGGFTDDANINQNADGNLVCLEFDIAENSEKSKVELTGLEDDIINWQASSGCFAPGCTGDVNKDGKITPQDALSAFEKYMGICPTTDGTACADICADVNYDDDVTPADALCIFNKYLEKPSCLDAEIPSCQN
jgi:hypothetical protein